MHKYTFDNSFQISFIEQSKIQENLVHLLIIKFQLIKYEKKGAASNTRKTSELWRS